MAASVYYPALIPGDAPDLRHTGARVTKEQCYGDSLRNVRFVDYSAILLEGSKQRLRAHAVQLSLFCKLSPLFHKDNGQAVSTKLHGILLSSDLLPCRRCSRQVWDNRQKFDFQFAAFRHIHRSPMPVDFVIAVAGEVVFTD